MDLVLGGKGLGTVQVPGIVELGSEADNSDVRSSVIIHQAAIDEYASSNRRLPV